MLNLAYKLIKSFNLAFQVVTVCFTCTQHMYRSVTKKSMLMKEHSLPTFSPIPCIGSKFTGMSTHPGANFALSLRSTASSTMHS